MATIKRSILLNCVISEVYFPFEIVDIELVGSSPNIPLLVPIGLEHSIYLTYHHVVPNVEFTLTVQEGTVDVELHDESLLCSVLVFSLTFHNGVKLVYFVNYSNAVTSVGKLSWLYDPNIPHRSTDRKAILFVLLLLMDNRLSLFVVDCESFVLWVAVALLNVKG